MALTDNIEAYWKLDAASGDESDSSGNGRTLTNAYDPGTTTGKINGARVFVPASSQYFIQAYDGVTGAAARSVQVWFKTTSAGGANTNCVFGHGSSAGAGLQWLCNIESGVIWVRCAGGNTASAGTGYNDGNWHHLVITFTASGNVTNIAIYVDGSSLSVTTTGTTALNTTATDFYIGNSSSGGITTTFSGTLDEFGLWSRALTSDEVTSLYNGGSGLAYPFVAATNTGTLVNGGLVNRGLVNAGLAA